MNPPGGIHYGKMKRGRVSLFTVVVIGAVAALSGIVVFSRTGDSPESAITQFLTALATKDRATLTARSFLPGNTPEELQKKWDETCRLTEYFVFQWHYKGAQTQTEKTAVAKVNMFGRGAVDQDFNVSMVKQDGKWKVDLSILDRKFFPSLPR